MKSIKIQRKLTYLLRFHAKLVNVRNDSTIELSIMSE